MDKTFLMTITVCSIQMSWIENDRRMKEKDEEDEEKVGRSVKIDKSG